MPLISDEIYHGLTYGEPATSALGLAAMVVVVSSFSKYWSMTGWRLGWLVLPENLVDRAERLAANLFICPPAVSQVAALAALDAGVRVGRPRRPLPHQPRGAPRWPAPGGDARPWRPQTVRSTPMPTWAGLTEDAARLCQRWLAELGVAATPGLDFDPQIGSRFVRFSFAGATADMVEAMDRLAHWYHST